MSAIEIEIRHRTVAHDENAKASGQPGRQIVDSPAGGFPPLPPLRQHILDYLAIRPEATWVHFRGDPESYNPETDPSPIESAIFLEAEIEPRFRVLQLLRYLAYGVVEFNEQHAFDMMVTLLSFIALESSPTNDIEGIPPVELLQIKWIRYRTFLLQMMSSTHGAVQGSKEMLATDEEIERAEGKKDGDVSAFGAIMRQLRTGESDPRPPGPRPNPTMRGQIILEQLKFDSSAVWVFHNYAGMGRVHVLGPTSLEEPTAVDLYATGLLREVAREALERTSKIPFMAGVLMVMFDRQSCVNEDPTNRFVSMQLVARELSQDLGIPVKELKHAQDKAKRILKELDRKQERDILGSIELYVDRPQLAYQVAGPPLLEKIDELERAILSRTQRNRKKKQRKLAKQPGSTTHMITEVVMSERSTKAEGEEVDEFDEDAVLTDLWALD